MAMENSDITLEHEAVDWSPFKLGQELDFHFSFFIFFLVFFPKVFHNYNFISLGRKVFGSECIVRPRDVQMPFGCKLYVDGPFILSWVGLLHKI